MGCSLGKSRVKEEETIHMDAIIQACPLPQPLPKSVPNADNAKINNSSDEYHSDWLDKSIKEIKNMNRNHGKTVSFGGEQVI